MPSSLTSFLACLALFAGLAADARAERQFSATAPAAKSRAPAESLTAGLAPSAVVALDALPASQVRALREKNTRGSSSAIQVGVVRDVADAAARSNALAWQAAGEASGAQWRVRVSDAQAIRVALDVRRAPDGLIARFASVARPGEVFAQRVSPGLSWSPLLAGGEALVEIVVPAHADARDVDISIARIADHFANPALPEAIAKSQWLAAPCDHFEQTAVIPTPPR